MRRLGTLVGELDQMPGGGSKVAARELVQLLMEVHGAGLERIMELVFEVRSAGTALIDRLGQDPIVRNLLLLYSLHPDDLETRVLKALDSGWSASAQIRCGGGAGQPSGRSDPAPASHFWSWLRFHDEESAGHRGGEHL